MEVIPYVQVVVALVPDRVSDAAWDVDNVSWPQGLLLATHLETGLAGDDLEMLVLDGMHMLRAGEAPPPEDAVELRYDAAGLLARPSENDPLSCYRVLDLIACSYHLRSP